MRAGAPKNLAHTGGWSELHATDSTNAEVRIVECQCPVSRKQGWYEKLRDRVRFRCQPS